MLHHKVTLSVLMKIPSPQHDKRLGYLKAQEARTYFLISSNNDMNIWLIDHTAISFNSQHFSVDHKFIYFLTMSFVFLLENEI